MTALDQLAISLWRAHSKALHAGMHGAIAAESLKLPNEKFEQQYAPMKGAWRAGAMAVLEGLKATFPDNAELNARMNDVLNEPEPEPVKALEPSPVDPNTNERAAPVPLTGPHPKGLPPGTQVTR